MASETYYILKEYFKESSGNWINTKDIFEKFEKNIGNTSIRNNLRSLVRDGYIDFRYLNKPGYPIKREKQHKYIGE